jgi:hypothetical protein
MKKALLVNTRHFDAIQPTALVPLPVLEQGIGRLVDARGPGRNCIVNARRSRRDCGSPGTRNTMKA